jgi:hypothetical protein
LNCVHHLAPSEMNPERLGLVGAAVVIAVTTVATAT